jgi:histidine triad (HIT) family protein
VNDTIFDKILSKDLPASIVYEDEYVLAFKDINPQAKIHVLVIPKKRARALNDLESWTTVEAGVFLKEVTLVAEHLKLEKSGYRVVFNTGNNACQSVPYLHAHILGGEMLSGDFA